MPQYFFTYHGGNKAETPEQKQNNMEEWKQWAADLGPALVNPGTPIGITKVLTKDGDAGGSSPHPIMGFSILQAETIEQAVELLAGCPHIHSMDGTLEVSEMMQLPG